MDQGSWTASLAASVGRVADRTFEYLPNLLGCVVLLLLGWLAASLLRSLTQRLAGAAMQRVARTRAIQARTERSRSWQSVPMVLGAAVYWTVLLFFLAAAIEALGLSAVSNVLGLVTVYLPQVLVALLIVFAGLWLGEFVRTLLARAAPRAGLGYGDLLGRGAQGLIVFLAIIIAVDQIGIDSTVLITTLATVFAATLGAAGLAFGLGARSTVGNIIAARYVQKSYRVGDTVRVGEHQGRIAEFTDTAVMLESEKGRVMVPAQRFSEEVSVRLAGDG